VKFFKLFLYFLFISFHTTNLFAIGLDGLKLNQNINNYLIISEEQKNEDNRIRKFDKNIKIYVNNTFNLGYENRGTYKDFKIPNPDYFWDVYYIYEKDKKSNYIVALKSINREVLQSEFKIGECSSLRQQYVREVIGANNSKKKKEYQNWISGDRIRFKDRIVHTSIENGISYNHLFSCVHSIYYSGDEHYVSTYFAYGINTDYQIVTDMDNYLNVKNLDEFNESLITNFKIWGNYEISDQNYLNTNLYSLKEYRNTAIQLHQEKNN